jgi:hypothetical protein
MNYLFILIKTSLYIILVFSQARVMLDWYLIYKQKGVMKDYIKPLIEYIVIVCGTISIPYILNYVEKIFNV